MSSVNDERNLLIELETTAEETRDAVAAKRAELVRLSAELDAGEAQLQATKRAVSETRERLAREEQLAAQRDRADYVDAETARMVDAFKAQAVGMPWYDGILDHQWQGAMFGAVAERWILGDGVGLGKTRTSIGWMDLVGARRVVVVCEPDICDQFAGEVMDLAPHRTVVNLYKRTPKSRHELVDQLELMDEAVVVVNFEIWRRDNDLLARIIGWQPDTVIVDEAHNLKHTDTANFKYTNLLISADNKCPSGHPIRGLWVDPAAQRKVAKPCPTCGWEYSTMRRYPELSKLEVKLLTRSVKNTCMVTGTPILNSPQDLYSLLHLSNPAAFPTMASFQKTYLRNNFHSGKWEFAHGGLAALQQMISGLFIARTREDTGVVLPPQSVRVVQVPLDADAYPKQARAIEQISETAKLELESGEKLTIMHVMALITRKRQANVWPGGIKVIDKKETSPTFGEVLFDASEIDESVKIDHVIDEIAKRLPERQIVFSQFKTALSEIEHRLSLRGVRVARLDGSTDRATRAEIKTNFNRALGEAPKWDVLLANYRTGGTGLNLTAATTTHILDEEWNPGKRNQSYGRTDRIGQTESNDVLVYRIPNSIDTWMSTIIRRKEQLVSDFNGTILEDEEELIDVLKQGLTK